MKNTITTMLQRFIDEGFVFSLTYINKTHKLVIAKPEWFSPNLTQGHYGLPYYISTDLEKTVELGYNDIFRK